MKKNRVINGFIKGLLQYLTGILLVFTVIISGSSCRGVKNLQYLQGPYDTAAISRINIPEPVIQKGDLLGIAVYSEDARATAAVTNPNAEIAIDSKTGSLSVNAPETGNSGYLVNQQGEIQLYKLGRLQVEGMTKLQLADTLTTLFDEKGLLKNPYVEVRFLNYKVTVIGEVNRPGSYSVPVDKISALEAIGLAGDVTQYGRRDNIRVIRETNGVRQIGTIDLSKPDAFLSPYYYLSQNDLVIVDVGKNKSAINNQDKLQTIAIISSLLTTTAIFINIFRN